MKSNVDSMEDKVISKMVVDVGVLKVGQEIGKH